MTIALCSGLDHGFDPKIGDFKVLRIVYRDVISFSKVVPVVAEVFDLSKGVWRVICPDIYSWELRHLSPNVYLNGAIHWFAFVRSCKILLSFDISEEVFRETELPDDVRSPGVLDLRRCINLMALGGLVSVMISEPDDVAPNSYSVWAMKECGVSESWTKLFTVVLPSSDDILDLLHIWENGDLVMANGKGLALYCPNGKVKWQLATRRNSFCSYVETLVRFATMN